MANFSFDVVSEVDLNEVDNAVNQAKKEILQRYDFKNSKASIEFNKKEKKITLIAENDFKLKAVVDALNTRIARRGVSLKSIKFGDPKQAAGGTVRQTVDIATGINKEKAKELVKLIKNLKLKVQSQIEGEKLRISSAKKDDLQTVMNHLKNLDFPIALSFCNYR